MNALRNKRPGLSLTEVLVAIFVMGIGMLALLVLFPVGLQNMRWAMQDDRLAAASAVAIANAEAVQMDPITSQPFSLRSEPNYTWAANYIPDNVPGPAGNGLFRWHPIPLGGYPNVPNYQPAYDPTGPRPPVFVDSLGVLAYGTSTADLGLLAALPVPVLAFLNTCPWGYAIGCGPNCLNTHEKVALPVLAGLPRPHLYGIPRVRSSNITFNGLGNINDALRACMLEDEVNFGSNGQPVNAIPSAMPVERDSRYSWAYMCRFPKGDDPSVVDMTIVLYNGRQLKNSLGHTSGEIRFVGNESFFVTSNPPQANDSTMRRGVVFTKGSIEAVIQLWDYNNSAPANNPTMIAGVPSPFKKGDVILDNTLVMPAFQQFADPLGGPPRRHYAPFTTDWTIQPTVPAVNPFTGAPMVPPTLMRTGIANGFFYKIINVGPVEQVTAGPGAGRFIQRLTLDRPALADGLEAVYLKGAVDIIEKSNGKMPGK